MLTVTRQTSAEKPLPDGHSLMIGAPESHGHWTFSVLKGQEPWIRYGLARGRVFIRGGRDTTGPSHIRASWRSADGTRADSLIIYLGAGPKTPPQTLPVADIDLVFDGPEVEGKARYRLLEASVAQAKQDGNLSGGFIRTYRTQLTPQDFCELYDAELCVVLRPLVNKVVEPPPPPAPAICPTCQRPL